MLKPGKRNSRRNFINKSLSLLVPASVVSNSKLDAKEIPLGKEQLITSDGTLVEVDKSVLNKIKANRSTSNKDILDWIRHRI